MLLKMAEYSAKFKEEQLTCSICFEIYDEPKTLPCHHYFCRSCLELVPLKLRDGKRYLPCPTCRDLAELPKDGGVAELPGTFHINSLKTLLLSPREPLSAVSTDFDKTEDDSLPRCITHGKPLELFCECQEIICQSCASRNHKSHGTHSTISEAYEKRCRLLEEHLVPLTKQLALVKDFTKPLEHRVSEIVENSKSAKALIDERADELIETIQQSKAKLLQEVDAVASAKLDVLKEQKLSIELTQTELQNLNNSIIQSLQNGDQCEMLRTSMKRIQEIKETVNSAKQEEPAPLEMAEILFIPDNNTEKVLSHIGDITCTLYCSDVVIEMIGSSFFENESPQVSVTLSIYYSKFPHVCISLLSTHCTVKPPFESQDEVKASLFNSDKPRQFVAKFSPVISGIYQLSVEVQSNSSNCLSIAVPFNPVYLHYTNITPLTCISVKNPMSITVTEDNRFLVVTDSSAVHILDEKGNNIKTLSRPNRGGNNFRYTRDVVVTTDNCFLVTDEHKLLKLTASGDLLATVGSGSGREALQFNTVFGVAVNHATGLIYVAEAHNHRIQVLMPNLTHAFFIGSRGKAPGQFEQPNDVAFDSKGLLYVTDTYNNRIQKFTPDGKFLMEFGRFGYNPGQFYLPERVVIKNDYLYVSEHYNCRVSVLTLDGKIIRCFGKERNEGGLKWPRGMAFDNNGHFYVCDFSNSCIHVY